MRVVQPRCCSRCWNAAKFKSCRPLVHRKRWTGANASQDPDASVSQMSLEEAESILGVKSTAGFDNILRAKDTAVRKARSSSDQEREFKIDAAYDVLLMQSMRSRLSGEMNVDNSVRFADVPVKKSPKQVVEENVLSRLPGGGVSVQVPPQEQLTPLVAGYTALIVWAFVQGATEPYAAQQADVAGLQLALGLAAGVYFLREKKGLGLGRSFLYGCIGLILGCIVGNLIEPLVRVDIVPLLGMGSPGVFVGEFGLLGLAAVVVLFA